MGLSARVRVCACFRDSDFFVSLFAQGEGASFVSWVLALAIEAPRGHVTVGIAAKVALQTGVWEVSWLKRVLVRMLQRPWLAAHTALGGMLMAAV